MILRRLARSVRRQDWFTVLIELLVVAVGIFLGLQVDEWRETRALQQREQAALARIADELDEMIGQFQIAVDVSERRVARSTLVLDALRRGELEEGDRPRFEAGLGELDLVISLPWRLATVDELIASGELGVVRDPRLRAGLVLLREQVRIANDALIHVRSEMSDYVPLVHLKVLFAPDDSAAFASRVASYDFDALAADPEVVNAVALSRRMQQAVVLNHSAPLQQARRLKEELEGAI
ncbi:MAG TPA: hypothetical protein VML95_01095 [Longimicrobiales bacterium]|nr:hypothetical protein [Longimicrobiales bacterium]